ncbi:restriction endonuclease [Luteimonas yanweni]
MADVDGMPSACIPATEMEMWAMGLKRVRERRNDALAGEDWARVERLLADYYRGQSYAVEHCGTGGRAARFDGGVDLRLRRDGETILVQCKHWNAYQVSHNAVHQLLGIIGNEQATGANDLPGCWSRLQPTRRGAWAPAGRDDRWPCGMRENPPSRQRSRGKQWMSRFGWPATGITSRTACTRRCSSRTS